MRRQIITLLALAVLMATALPAFAGSPLDWSKETNRSACDARGAPVVNVNHRVTGDIDSGFNGGWAVDTYNRTIQLWEVADGTYCAVVRYSGTFDATEGATSPGEGSENVLEGNEDGNFVGGYRATIEGSLLSDFAWSDRGTVGQFDYECVGPRDCPGAVNWVDQYFEAGYGFTYEFWGWVYRAGRHGTWVNASTGSSGDIG